MKLKSITKSCLTLAMAVTMTASASAADIVDTAVQAGKFNTLAAALGAADLVDTLKGDGPFTVFAPTDEAFAKLPAGTVETLLKPENQAKLAGILTYHVVPGSVMAKQVVGLTGATTVNGQRVDIAVDGSSVTVDGANVIATDIQCDNGVIHIIDSVILPADKTIPETAAAAGSFGTLLAAVKAAGLAETLGGGGPFTVFAPTDEAFEGASRWHRGITAQARKQATADRCPEVPCRLRTSVFGRCGESEVGEDPRGIAGSGFRRRWCSLRQ